jgi:hypothetical protein
MAKPKHRGTGLTPNAVDGGQRPSLSDAIKIDLGRKPAQVSADRSEVNLEALGSRRIDAPVATG